MFGAYHKQSTSIMAHYDIRLMIYDALTVALCQHHNICRILFRCKTHTTIQHVSLNSPPLFLVPSMYLKHLPSLKTCFSLSPDVSEFRFSV